MSELSLSKLYGDTELLYKSDIDTMWDELEAKVNGDIDSDNVQSGWATLGQLTLSKDVTYTMGLTDTGYVTYTSSTDDLEWGNTYAGGDIIFKVESAEAARIDASSNDFLIQKDVYFKDRSTAFSLYRLIGTYQKPVLVYVSSTVIDVENNTETANQTLIVFPSGPIAVTEDTSATNKFRRLSTAATANGYESDDTGAADSGLRVGLTLSANTWYFVYAVRVQYGDDAGNNFILVVDDTNPTYGNHATLDARYGTGEWVYLGTIRRGYGEAATTTLIPFQQDHQGWTCFTDRSTADNYFGLVIAITTITSTTETAKWTVGVSNSGDNLPANVTAFKMDIQSYQDGDSDFELIYAFYSASGYLFANLPHIESDGGQMGFSVVLPVISGSYLAGHRAGATSTDDGGVEIYVTAFLDHYV